MIGLYISKYISMKVFKWDFHVSMLFTWKSLCEVSVSLNVSPWKSSYHVSISPNIYIESPYIFSMSPKGSRIILYKCWQKFTQKKLLYGYFARHKMINIQMPNHDNILVATTSKINTLSFFFFLVYTSKLFLTCLFKRLERKW